MKEMVGGCCVCSDERGWPDNPLVYCDGNGCTVAVHQACYGIVTVPTGPWYCRKCESPDNKGKVRCELCPSKSGALKRSDTGGWAHVVCALYIPEVRFGNVTSMEPIVLKLIPSERFNKTCYICQDQGKTHRASAGACMQCNKSGCKQQFHVTCAQSLGLLCEEAGNYLDNVKYCGYCQHHYSKLKKGGNVKTIPPYKPVSHDSPSSDSSGEKEGDASPKAGGGTPTHPAKAKASGRKSSHSGTSVSGKSTPNSAKTPTNTSQPMDTSTQESPAPAPEPAASGRKSKHSDKHKSKKSPARRGSSAGDSGAGSKTSTPAPSPQHNAADAPQPTPPRAGASQPTAAKVGAPATSVSGSKAESVGVISAAPLSAGVTSAASAVSTAVTTSVVQSAGPGKPPHQESVITNAESMESKQTKKRKAATAAAAANPHEYASNIPSGGEMGAPSGSSMWDSAGHHSSTSDVPMEAVEKIVKKAKTEGPDGAMINPHYNTNPPPPPPPPPAHSPSLLPSPRHPNLPSPRPGPSGMSQPSNIRSPQQARSARESLLVSVPLPVQGLNLTAHSLAQPQLAAMQTEHPGTSPHIFHHQVQKQAAMEQGGPAHAQHPPGRASWGPPGPAYDMQDPNKNSMSGPATKDASANVGATARNKKRAAMATSVVSMASTGSSMQSPGVQMLANVRRQPPPPPQPTPPPPVYQTETIKDSPPSSPGSEKPLKPKMETRLGGGLAAPHMLGNELNPESGVAARLQEQLSAELAAHACAGAPSPLIPPPLINKGASSSGARGSSGAQSLDQLLERQWEQGSQFLMEQAQHFDIASLLSCLHQLRTENVRLEEHVGSLLQRRDHLLAVNARLAIPLTAQQSASTGAPEPGRCPRENGAQMRAPAGPARADSLAADRSHQMMREVQQKPS